MHHLIENTHNMDESVVKTGEEIKQQMFKNTLDLTFSLSWNYSGPVSNDKQTAVMLTA